MSTAFRSIAPFVRTARQSLKTGRVSPLQSALRSNAAALNLYRTYAVYERTKPHVNIGMEVAMGIAPIALLTIPL